MSTDKEALEKKFIDWGLSSNGVIVPLRSRNIFNEKALAEGIQMLKEYLELADGCISHDVLQIIVELYAQICLALPISIRQNNKERTEALLNAVYQIQRLVFN